MPEVREGDDLPRLLIESAGKQGLEINQGDIIIVAQKIVSKAEGRRMSLSEVKPGVEAMNIAQLCGKDPRFVELVLRESDKLRIVKPGHLIVTTRHGITCANAGIDVSNVEGTTETVLLLPVSPDESAKRIRTGIKDATGWDVGVIISDTHGRTLRDGQVNVAIGSSGVVNFRDYRGKRDMRGYVLHVKQISVADELAGAAELVMGQADEATPAAIIRGLPEIVDPSKEGSAELNMPDSRWFFKPEQPFAEQMVR